MPELPEVEVVRRGLADHVVGRTLVSVEVTGARTARRQPGGAAEIVARLTGRTVSGAR
ncbi:DNA-formamidopyrimidine glycosylase, partial [Dietzia sp. E1]|nr:DNA-formamidopyrimidine glycosylase [Dietzia sp. E1]